MNKARSVARAHFCVTYATKIAAAPTLNESKIIATNGFIYSDIEDIDEEYPLTLRQMPPSPPTPP
jgi:hypothetical protein